MADSNERMTPRPPAEDSRAAGRSASPADRKAKHRHRRRGRNVWRLVLRIVLLVALLAGLILALLHWRDLAPDAMVEWIEERFTGKGKGEGFPLSIEGDTVLDMTQVGRQMAVLTDTSLVFLSQSAGTVRTCSFPFANARMFTAGRYVLLLEQGGSRYQLETRFETWRSERIAAGNLLTGCVDEKGNFALALRSASQDYLSEVVLFDRNGNRQFLWQSPKWLVTDVALRDGRLAVTGLSAVNGALESALILFSYRSDPNNPVRVEQSNVLFSRVFLLADGTAAVYSEQSVQTFDKAGARLGQFSYGGMELTAVCCRDDKPALVLSPAGGQGGYLVILDRTAAVAMRSPFSGAFRSLTAGGPADFWLLTDAALAAVNTGGVTQTASVGTDSRLAADFDGQALILGLTELRLHKQEESP